MRELAIYFNRDVAPQVAAEFVEDVALDLSNGFDTGWIENRQTGAYEGWWELRQAFTPVTLRGEAVSS